MNKMEMQSCLSCPDSTGFEIKDNGDVILNGKSPKCSLSGEILYIFPFIPKSCPRIRGLVICKCKTPYPVIDMGFSFADLIDIESVSPSEICHDSLSDVLLDIGLEELSKEAKDLLKILIQFPDEFMMFRHQMIGKEYVFPQSDLRTKRELPYRKRTLKDNGKCITSASLIAGLRNRDWPFRRIFKAIQDLKSIIPNFYRVGEHVFFEKDENNKKNFLDFVGSML